MRLTGSGSYSPYSARAVLASLHASMMRVSTGSAPPRRWRRFFCQLMLFRQDCCEMLFTPRACERICGRSWLP